MQTERIKDSIYMKHAYLIIAHQEKGLLTTLLSLLDDERNDIYLHIDKKSQGLFEEMKKTVLKHARFYLLDERIDIRWGDISQVKVELLLIRTALSCGTYSYLHLLSGVDMPIKSQDYIHDFFETHNGYEFVGFAQGEKNEQDLAHKTRYVYLFTSYLKDANALRRFGAKCIRNSFVKCQQLFNYKRHYAMTLKKGANWFSITSPFANFILLKEKYILSTFKHTLSPDESFMQTLLWNSDSRFLIYNKDDEFEGCMRLIDWERGGPYVWTFQDKKIIQSSNKLFARKFSSEASQELISFIKSLCQRI